MNKKYIILLIPLLLVGCGQKEEANEDNAPQYRIQDSYSNKNGVKSTTRETDDESDKGDNVEVTQNGKKVTVNTNDYYSSDARMLEPGDKWVVTNNFKISVNSAKPNNTTSVIISYNVENLTNEDRKFIPKTVIDQDFNKLEATDVDVPTIKAGEKKENINVTYLLEQPKVSKLQVIFSEKVSDSQTEDAVFTSLFEN
jgi:lipoprotein